MGGVMANSKNLRPGRITTEEASILGAKGGKASVKARREKKLMSEVYTMAMAKRYKVTIEGEKRDLRWEELMTIVIRDIMAKRDSCSVSLMKEIREATEGSNVNLKGVIADVDTSKLSKEKQETLLDAVVELINVKE
jgi:predicted DNA-binding ribbon-helix-helix protein